MSGNGIELLKVENVTKKYEGKTVLDNISFTLKTGEILGLIGKSASGKSVLMHMIRGAEEYRPDSGRVLYHVNLCTECDAIDTPKEGGVCPVCGKPCKTEWIDYWAIKEKDNLRYRISSRISIMLQRTFALFGDSTVLENLYEAMPDKLNDMEKVNKAIKLLEFVNMTHRTTHIARDLSGGEKQRVVLARQLAKDPLFFVADEPTGTLDPFTANVVHNRLVEYVRSHNICMVFASHWPEAIEKMADQAIWLDRGKAIMQGKPHDITAKFMEEYRFEKSEEHKLGEPLIKLTDAKKHYFSVVRGVVKAVDGVNLEIREGEIFGLAGYSGAGKTTTSRMIAGMAPATSGKVEIKIGDTWVNMSDTGEGGKGRATPYIGVLHQEYALYPSETILQNLTSCIGLKMPAELAKVKAIQALLSVGFPRDGMDKLLNALPGDLSVGEVQRVAFALVLIKEPKFVVLDEPTGTMDPITKVAVAKAVIKARNDLNETFIVVSHDMDFILNCCDRVALMKDGKIADMGSAEKIVEELKVLEKEIIESGGEL
ncbi:MAG: methyl coenzyme M reductase system, component A2 [Candidatus Methanomethylophilaceae archaeon]|nr:methyl coenzyme M reductase system, component A2 [Candidatus Methanomethylophilaceae archaeon]MBP5395280.1 methyl coenzyme M reductase system, component A2 [Candidatus Methanomethylophilaceae archaeon]